MSTQVVLVRHGAYVHQPAPEGTEASTDAGLSDLGRRQAEALRERLARTGEIRAHALYCSTLPRARETAALIAPALALQPLPLAELCEWESGNEALGMDRFMATFNALPAAERRHHRFYPGRETIAEFATRVHGALRGLLQAHENQTTVLVVHGGVVEAAFSFFLGFGPGPFEGGYPAAGHASLTLWQQSDSRSAWRQEYANDRHHLQDVIA